ncbi:MAG: SRPBCC family protein [Thaumarchaeota archaeon]|nr:SRPBCC family protein [Nitrososphaerota archaeon]
MDSVTETCVVPVPKDKVFQFLSDIENLAKWSTQFVKKLIVVNGKHKAITPMGEVFLRIESDKRSGLIDIYAGITEQEMTPAYLRVIPFSEDSTGVMFTFFKWASTDDVAWKIFCEWIKVEVGNIKRCFS